MFSVRVDLDWRGKCWDFPVRIIWQGKRNTKEAAESHYLPELILTSRGLLIIPYLEFCLELEVGQNFLKKKKKLFPCSQIPSIKTPFL